MKKESRSSLEELTQIDLRNDHCHIRTQRPLIGGVDVQHKITPPAPHGHTTSTPLSTHPPKHPQNHRVRRSSKTRAPHVALADMTSAGRELQMYYPSVSRVCVLLR